jgi:hypothetical protein
MAKVESGGKLRVDVDDLVFEPDAPAAVWTGRAELIMQKNYARFAAARRVSQLGEILRRETGQPFTNDGIVGKAKRMGLQKGPK